MIKFIATCILTIVAEESAKLIVLIHVKKSIKAVAKKLRKLHR